jgi:hypothetical protein
MEGGVKFSVRDRGAAKRTALRSIKHLARELPKTDATAAASKGGEAAWQQFVRALDWFLTLFEKAFSTSGRTLDRPQRVD